MSSKKRPPFCLDASLSKLEPRKRTVTCIQENKDKSRTNNWRSLPCFPSEKNLKLLSLLSELEFRKAFLLFSYVGRNKIVNIVSYDNAVELLSLMDLSMEKFEEFVWCKYGHRYLGKDSPDRINHHDWDSRRTHIYYCHVYQDGTYSFKGPCLDTTKSHLQRALGDENILIVRFNDSAMSPTNCANNSSDYNAMVTKIVEEGIPIGLRLYRFFAYKDGGREEKKNPFLSSVKFYFVRMESVAPSDEDETYILEKKTIHEARRLFIHLHMTHSIAKYASRFSLILSKTIKLQVDLRSVLIEVIEDVPCRDQNGCVVYEDGERLNHTNGTGYIAEDLAMKCPKNIFSGKYIKDQQFELVEKIKGSAEKNYHVQEPPLLIQCRLFKNGLAVKGTLLLNKKLKSGTIQIRRSMIKVEVDSTLPNEHSLNSLEVVAISHKPRKGCTLSKNLIALLSFGGVPKDFFLNLLQKALEESRIILTNRRAAIRFLLRYGDRDDVNVTRRLVESGIPLDEPCLRNCLTRLVIEAKNKLQCGKLPISESYYLMGTADPTGLLENNQVCVILGNGQVTGDVLVYRNPGLHFGDIHVLKATYVKAIKDVVGNAKYGIFFSIRGQRSMAKEMGDGDLDGDMYWVSQNTELLRYYKPSPPWKRTYPTSRGLHSKPSDFPSKQLEQALIQHHLIIRKQSKNIWVAADSWLAFMDQLLIMGDNNPSETEQIKKRMLQLVDIYYDALDAAKSGKKVVVPKELEAKLFPHYMDREMENTYHSFSVLGQIYDTLQSRQTQTVSAAEIWKLHKFEKREVPRECLMLWRKKYDDYIEKMSYGMKSDEFKDCIIQKYKQMLYEATAFEHSNRKEEDIYNDALALYHASYEHAKSTQNVGKCLFAWQVAGEALCKFHVMKETRK